MNLPGTQEDREAGSDPNAASKGAGGASGDGSGITGKRSVKEAKGNKAPEILELLAKHLLFRPTYHVRAFRPAERMVTAFELRELKRAAEKGARTPLSLKEECGCSQGHLYEILPAPASAPARP